MIAPQQKQSISLRISVTDRCQLRCLYCMPPEGIPKCNHSDVLSFEEILRFVRVIKSRFGLSKVHLTGGEPLVRPGIVRLVEMLACEGIEDLALTTNGQCLAPMAHDLKQAGLKRLNLSMDSLDESTYASLSNGGQLDRTLEGVRTALRVGLFPIKLNVVVLRGHNDAEVVSMTRWAIEHNCHIRFLELMPIGYAKKLFRDLFVPTTEVRARLEKSFDLVARPYKTAQSSRNFLVRDAQNREGRVGFITAHSKPFCHGCRRLRLTSTGQLIGCLAREKNLDAKSIIRTNAYDMDEALCETIESALSWKRSDNEFQSSRTMASVGG